ncbi:hypothetical protein MCAL106L_0207 [Mycoplasmopsis californica]|nr:hypothetical protein MCAL106_0207 [Mycoplasmopsis californica]BBG41355.1 hypothetical protein MCAL106E_0207 [Mycoplasmopsis californica]BBG41948.1 hypothetical protein MCAL106L_0207 [Mycoplasmopsis californica]
MSAWVYSVSVVDFCSVFSFSSACSFDNSSSSLVFWASISLTLDSALVFASLAWVTSFWASVWAFWAPFSFSPLPASSSFNCSSRVVIVALVCSFLASSVVFSSSPLNLLIEAFISWITLFNSVWEPPGALTTSPAWVLPSLALDLVSLNW